MAQSNASRSDHEPTAWVQSFRVAGLRITRHVAAWSLHQPHDVLNRFADKCRLASAASRRHPAETASQGLSRALMRVRTSELKVIRAAEHTDIVCRPPFETLVKVSCMQILILAV